MNLQSRVVEISDRSGEKRVQGFIPLREITSLMMNDDCFFECVQ